MGSRIQRVALALSLLALAGCASTGGTGETTKTARREKSKSGKHSSAPVKMDPKAEAARLRVERDRLAQANQLLEQELAEAHEDLKRVERQFAVYERRLASEQGKADAVASAAEARMRSDRLSRARPSVLADSTQRYVNGLIETSESLIRKQNYAGAQFFAERANHVMSSAERRASIEKSAITRTVSVDVANVREGPGQNYPVVARVAVGQALLCWGEANEWYHVRTPQGSEGWIHISLVR
ncbi:MAG TPA: SH3 domain-containing protein [Candidatus Krumholzibacteria bacterium]|nr:SH3 domain-containing protein [Candidatus Krumholzibacteria bacterium]